MLVPALCVGAGLYTYEWLAWTPRSKEDALKRQFVQHMREKVQLQVKATNNSCISQMQGTFVSNFLPVKLAFSTSHAANLQFLRGQLNQRLNTCHQENDHALVQLARQQDSLSALLSRLKALR